MLSTRSTISRLTRTHPRRPGILASTNNASGRGPVTTKAGMHAFRRGCNRRWELARVNPAVIRQQMGHASAAMTAQTALSNARGAPSLTSVIRENARPIPL
jgi:integrase